MPLKTCSGLTNYNAEKSKTRLTLPVVKELDRVTVSGNTYVVDGKHVQLDHTEEERTIAKVLVNYLGKGQASHFVINIDKTKLSKD